MRFLLVPVVAALVLLGIWATGGLVTDDFRVAMLLTGLWIGLAGVAALAVAWRRRRLALPVLGTYLLTALAAGGYLAYASMVDRIVDERVASAGVPTAAAGGDESDASPPRNVALARGVFTSGEHETVGQATVVQLGAGGRVLTLTDFATSPGPDLRVYLVSGDAGDLGDVVDLGGLKGNKGDQQYELPVSLDVERHRTVVVWCRAFSVSFGSAALA